MTVEVVPTARGRRMRRLLVVLATAVVAVIVVLAAVQQWLLGVVRVPSIPMEPTIRAGDNLLVDKAVFGLSGLGRGEIVLLSPVSDGRVLRVLGLGGDRIACRDGRLERNGSLVDEPYLPDGTVTDCAAVTVPSDSVYLLGDNRGQANDSRLEGPYSMDDVGGRMITRLWSDDPRPER